ncbi:MAG: serine O-acetyltransferase [Clostridiales bacterium]|nr:serine O-acetyltransferase [Clostridiales bacterium]
MTEIKVNIDLDDIKQELKKVKDEIKTDIRVIRERDPAATSDLEVALLYSGFHAVLAYRLSHKLYEKKKFFAARMVSQGARFLTGIEIHPGAKIGRGLFIDHGSAVVIGETTEIGDNCTLYQGVTLGGTGKHVGKRHPTLGDNVMVGSGAKVLGPFKVGSNSKIAANAVVLEEIPDNSTAVGIPARVVKRGSKKVECDLDQIHIPDPVAQELCKLTMRIEKLEKELAEEKNKSKE